MCKIPLTSGKYWRSCSNFHKCDLWTFKSWNRIVNITNFVKFKGHKRKFADPVLNIKYENWGTCISNVISLILCNNYLGFKVFQKIVQNLPKSVSRRQAHIPWCVNTLWPVDRYRPKTCDIGLLDNPRGTRPSTIDRGFYIESML